MPWEEFSLIGRLFRPLSQGEAGAFDLTDDAAVLHPAEGCDWVVTADALVAGVHFFADDPPESIAKKMMRVNVSDLAAMGAKPRGVFMTCALPRDLTEAWLVRFADGVAGDCRAFGVTLAGGDVVATPGPLTLSVTAMGEAREGRVLRRNGMEPGDIVAVTGTIGDAALGLDLQREGRPGFLSEDAAAFLLDRYRHPEPRVEAGLILNGADVSAHAAMDISDGLFGDLKHMAEVSGVDVVVDVARIPLSEAARAWVSREPGRIERIAGGGDDYELAFSCAADDFRGLDSRLSARGVKATAIGRAVEGSGRVYRIDADGTRREASGGHRHGGT